MNSILIRTLLYVKVTTKYSTYSTAYRVISLVIMARRETGVALIRVELWVKGTIIIKMKITSVSKIREGDAFSVYDLTLHLFKF